MRYWLFVFCCFHNFDDFIILSCISLAISYSLVKIRNLSHCLCTWKAIRSAVFWWSYRCISGALTSLAQQSVFYKIVLRTEINGTLNLVIGIANVEEVASPGLITAGFPNPCPYITFHSICRFAYMSPKTCHFFLLFFHAFFYPSIFSYY